MSAFLCSNDHLSALALLAGANFGECEAAFSTLLDENCRSLLARYPTDPFCGQPDPREYRQAINREAYFPHILAAHGRWDVRKLTDSMVNTAIVKLCDCYDYQACETGDSYYETAAGRMVAAIRDTAIGRGGLAQGEVYDLMPWGL